MIAQTILEQLGGSRFLAMTGAKNLLDHGKALSFRLPGGAGFTRNGINYVKITLNADDLYDLEFGRVRGSGYWVISSLSGVYCDTLRDVFRQATGLDTDL